MPTSPLPLSNARIGPPPPSPPSLFMPIAVFLLRKLGAQSHEPAPFGVRLPGTAHALPSLARPEARKVLGPFLFAAAAAATAEAAAAE